MPNPFPNPDTQFKPGNPGGPGRPSKMAVWQAQVENELEKWVKPFEDQLGANLSASFQGAVYMSEFPDYATRTAAAEKVLDRVYGKATQKTEVSGQVDLRALMTGETGDAFTE